MGDSITARLSCHPVKIFTFVPKLWRFDCICSSSGIAARCCYCSRSKSSLWLIWFSVSWSKMLFVAMLVCGGTQGSSSHVPGVTNRIHQLHPQLWWQQLLPPGPPAVTPSCSQVFMPKQPLPPAAARHFSSFHLQMFSGPEPQSLFPSLSPKSPHLSAHNSVAS